MKDKKRLLSLFTLIACGGVIYVLPYLRQSYHGTMLEVFQISNTELGWLNSVFGIFAVICYTPGGWLADRIAPNRLLAFSMTGSGLAGFYFATLPSYSGLLLVHAIWGITTILTFWAAYIKATREIASAKDQAKIFGIVEGGRGLFEAIVGVVNVTLLAAFATQQAGLQGIILFCSALSCVIGFLCWFSLPQKVGTPPENKAHRSKASSLQLIKEVLGYRSVWLMSLIVLCAYTCFWGTFSLAYFATDALDQTEVYGASLSTFRMWFRPFAAVMAGFIATRTGTKNFILFCFVMMAGAFLLLAWLPNLDSILMLLWADTAALAFLVFALRGVYFALLEDSKIPLYLTGSAVGLISVIGYLPDVFFPLLTGWIYDAYPGKLGHQMLFIGLAFVSVLGFVATLQINRGIKKGF